MGAKVLHQSPPGAARVQPCYTVHQSIIGQQPTTVRVSYFSFFFMQNGFLSFNLHSQFFFAKQENHNKKKFLFRN